MHFVVKQHWLTRQWRWRLVAANGRSVAVSGESYINRTDCLSAIELVKGATAATVRFEGG